MSGENNAIFAEKNQIWALTPLGRRLPLPEAPRCPFWGEKVAFWDLTPPSQHPNPPSGPPHAAFWGKIPLFWGPPHPQRHSRGRGRVILGPNPLFSSPTPQTRPPNLPFWVQKTECGDQTPHFGSKSHNFGSKHPIGGPKGTIWGPNPRIFTPTTRSTGPSPPSPL